MSEETKKTNWLASWCKGLKAEFKKITWSTRETITKETSAVLFVSVLLGVLITVIDLIVRSVFELVF